MRKNKHFITAVCMVLGVIILTTAAFANFDNANGYTAYKNSLKKLLYMDDFTLKFSGELEYNGETIVKNTALSQLDWDGEVVMHTYSYDDDDRYGYEMYKVRKDTPNGNCIQISSRQPDERWDIYADNIYDEESTVAYQVFGTDGETTNKVIDFAELLADTFVGDLKNNFVITGNEDGVKSYNITLSGNQLPELITSGMSLLFSSAREGMTYGGIYVNIDEGLHSDDYSEKFDELYKIGEAVMQDNDWNGGVVVHEDGSTEYFEDVVDYRLNSTYKYGREFDLDYFLLVCETEPQVESASCTLSIDENGNLIANQIKIIICGYDVNGEKQTMSMEGLLEVSDIGTTVIAMPEMPDSATIYDYSTQTEENGYEYTITKNGITTTRSQTEDSQADEREWLFGLEPAKFVNVISSYDSEGLQTYIEEVLGMTVEDFAAKMVEILGSGTELPNVNEILESDSSTTVAIIGGADSATDIIVSE